VAFHRQRQQVLARHVLVVEGEHVDRGRELPQRVEVGVVPQRDVAGDEPRGFVLARGEHAQGLAEGDRRLVGHPGQLAAAHHAHDGQTGVFVHSADQTRR